MIAVYLFVSSPSSPSVDPGTDVDLETDAAPKTDDTTDDPAFAAEQGKHPPFEHSNIAYSLLPYACIRNCCCYCFTYSDA